MAETGRLRWDPARPAGSLDPAARRRPASKAGLGAFGVVVAVTLIVRALALEPLLIPSESMLPTLEPGDRLFVNKLAFGAPLPFSAWRLPALREPRRGEVVVFEVARRGAQVAAADARPRWPRERFVKRIVGLPGDRVRVAENGLVSVNGAPVATWPTGELVLDRAGRPLHGRRAVLGATEHAWLDDPGTQGRAVSLRVPAGRYLLVGDNRDHSNDGRFFGTVGRAELTGPASRIYWSRAPEGAIRWSRIGRRVQ